MVPKSHSQKEKGSNLLDVDSFACRVIYLSLCKGFSNPHKFFVSYERFTDDMCACLILLVCVILVSFSL